MNKDEIEQKITKQNEIYNFNETEDLIKKMNVELSKVMDMVIEETNTIFNY